MGLDFPQILQPNAELSRARHERRLEHFVGQHMLTKA